MQLMKKDFETKFAGWAFLLASALLWLGWTLSNHHTGEYIEASDFEKIGENVWYWIWMYRIHIFGWVTMTIALMSLVSFTARNPFRVLILPGAGMAIVGSITLALASAFYYNFGAAGVGATMGMNADELKVYMDAISSTNQYATCLVRFGRIFSGVGLILLGAAFVKWKMFSGWLSWFTVLLGLVAMCTILFIPDNFEVYKPIFHVKAVWLVAMGVTLLTKGVHLQKAEA
jgi:hypothetical protein